MLSIGDEVYWLDLKVDNFKIRGTIEHGKVIACTFFNANVSILYNDQIIIKHKSKLVNEYHRVLKQLGYSPYECAIFDRTPFDGP